MATLAAHSMHLKRLLRNIHPNRPDPHRKHLRALAYSHPGWVRSISHRHDTQLPESSVRNSS